MSQSPLDSELTTASHWGAMTACLDGERILVKPLAEDERPSPCLDAVARLPFLQSRIQRPAVRRAFLEKRLDHAALRGKDEWVPLSWPEALDLAASEINRIYDVYGPSAVFGHSYGWKSSGALHAPCNLVRRLLALRGGCVRGVNTYSNAAAATILPYVIGTKHPRPQSLEMIVQHAERLVFWGADPAITNDIDWFTGIHADAPWTRRLAEKARAGRLRTYAINPLRPETAREFGAQWLPVRPGTDAALMLALIWTLDAEDLIDREFLQRCTHGSEALLAYVRGQEDGIEKTPRWAAGVTGLPEDRIRPLARDLASHRTYLICGWGPQRAKYGEQFHWMAFALAAALGQIGLPGGGLTEECHKGSGGAPEGPGPFLSGIPVPGTPAIPPSRPFEGSRAIPTARFVDAIEHPGKTIDFNGGRCTYPAIRLLLWAGGNPFSHQPDTLRLERAWRSSQLESVIVCDTHWSATAKHADIVLPACTFFERSDITACGEHSNDGLIAMHRILPPRFDSRSDYWIFTELAKRLGIGPAFTEGLDESGWIRKLYCGAAQKAASAGVSLPPFEEFWEKGKALIPPGDEARRFVDFALFRADPKQHPLSTPSGLIELYSERIASFHYADCPPHPAWLEPPEGVSRATQRFPFTLISPKSRKRLHSQLDELANLQNGRQDFEPLEIHPEDAALRGIADGDLVLIQSPRGATLARARCTADVMRCVVVLRHGAWLDPLEMDDETLDRHGCANMLLMDEPASSLSCGNISSGASVQVFKWQEEEPAIEAFMPPEGA